MQMIYLADTNLPIKAGVISKPWHVHIYIYKNIILILLSECLFLMHASSSLLSAFPSG